MPQVTRGDVVLRAAAAFDELIAWLQLLRVDWWVHSGWSVRRMDQLELSEEKADGRGSENHEQEHRTGGSVATEVAPGDDDGVSGHRAAVAREVWKTLAKTQLARRKTSKAPVRRRPRRQKRVSR